MPIVGEPTSGLEPLTCSLRVRFEALYLSRKVATYREKCPQRIAVLHAITPRLVHRLV
jgi:hypothetical protein